MKRITTIIFGLLALLNTISINSQVIENNSKVVMSEADITSLAKTLKKHKKTKDEITDNNLKQVTQFDNSYEIEYLRRQLAQLENQSNYPEVYRNKSKVNEDQIRAMQNEILQLKSSLDKQLNSKVNTPNVVVIPKNSESAKKDEIKIIYVDKSKKEEQPINQYEKDTSNFALKVVAKEVLNETNLYNANFDSIQKKLLDIKNSMNVKAVQPSIIYDSLSTNYSHFKKQLFFESNKSDLDLNQMVILDDLVQILSKNDNFDVYIKGFASNKGNPVFNENLSLQRTESVKKALVSKGIHPTRILTQYHGIDYESATNELARRVDIEFLIRK